MPKAEIVPLVREKLDIVVEVVGAVDELPLSIVQLPDVPADAAPPPSNAFVIAPEQLVVIGLKPSTGTDVVPSGSPVGGTGNPGTVPSGEVTPSGDALGALFGCTTCAEAVPQSMKAAAMINITERSMIDPPIWIWGLGDQKDWRS